MLPSGVPRPAPPSTRQPADAPGFTLVELVVVLVILGVLAALAAPRFVDAASAARYSKMSHLYRSFQTGTNLAHAFWTARGQPPTGVMTVQGQLVPINNDWPTPTGALHMLNAGNPPPFVPIVSGDELEIRESADRPHCRFIYRPPATTGAGPEYINEVTRTNCAS